MGVREASILLFTTTVHFVLHGAVYTGISRLYIDEIRKCNIMHIPLAFPSEYSGLQGCCVTPGTTRSSCRCWA